MGRPVTFDLAGGGGSAAEFYLGTVYLTPTRMHVVGSRTVLPDAPSPIQLVNGKGTHPDVAPSPDGANPEWAYVVTIVNSINGKGQRFVVGVPEGESSISFNSLPKFQEAALSTIADMQYWMDHAEQAAAQAQMYSELTTSAIGEAYNATERLEDYVLRAADDTFYAIPFADADGFAAGGVTSGGNFNFEKPPTVMGLTGATFQPVHAPGYAQVFVDRDGYMAMGITVDGEIVTYKGGSSGGVGSLRAANEALGYTKTPGNKITFAGDSLTEGYFDGSPGPTADSWATKLIALFNGSVTGTNLGLSGYTVDEEALRVGALQPALTVSGGSIPASGSVAVTTSTVIGWRTANRSLSFVGTIEGVPGTLARASDGTYTFTRATPGAAVSVSAGVKFVSEHNARSGEIITVLLGRNDVSRGVKGSHSTVAEHVVAGITRIVQWQSRDISKVLILSVTNAKDEIRGTAGYNTVKAINDQLSELYGPRFLDIRTALVHDSLAVMGITPTSADLTAMAADAPPPSIMDDGTHWSREGHTFVAQLVHKYLTDREWTD